MTHLVGLGGTGSKFVRSWEQSGRPFDGALTIDTVPWEDPMTAEHSSIHHLQLIDSGDDLTKVIADGISLSINAPDSQERLRGLASWRPDPTRLMIPLAFGSGKFRSIGRAIGIAKREKIHREVQELLMDSGGEDLVIAASTDGGLGSSLVQEILEIIASDPGLWIPRSITLVLFDSLVLDFTDSAANSFRTLSEIATAHLRDPYLFFKPTTDHVSKTVRPAGKVHYVVIQTRAESQIDDALAEFSQSNGTRSAVSHRIHLEGGVARTEVDPDSTGQLWMGCLRRSAERLHKTVKNIDLLARSGQWALGRTRPITDTLACDPVLVRNVVRGWIALLSTQRLAIEDGYILFRESETVHRVPLLRETNSDAIDALPILVEALPLLSLLQQEEPSLGRALEFLVEYGKTFEVRPVAWRANQPAPQTTDHGLKKDLSDHYGLLAPPTSISATRRPPSSDEQIRFVEEQLRLATEFALEPYDGEEYVIGGGAVVPDATLFRDIATIYISVCQEFVDGATDAACEPLATETVDLSSSQPRPPARSPGRQATSRLRAKQKQSRWVYAKPRMWIRFGVPAFLAVVSIAGTLIFLSSDRLRVVWSDTATAVGGIMGSVAVCLGAVALIWSIQNSSVETSRTDRLFAACLGIQEATHMLRIALQNASLTNEFHADGPSMWNHQSLRLAAVLLGRRLVEALDAGLFGLLISIDDDNGASADSLTSSASRQVFVLLDDLVRVAPEIISDRDADIRERPAAPEKVLQLAERLRILLEPVTYRYMAESLRRTPSPIDVFGADRVE